MEDERFRVSGRVPSRSKGSRTRVPKVDEELRALQDGPANRFAEVREPGVAVPNAGAGVYTIWDDAGGLVYVGIAGRNPEGRGLAGRLSSHASGRRSGDQFCVYVADHYVMPVLTRDQIEAIRDSELSMDALVRDCIHESFVFRLVAVDNYKGAMEIENAVKSGALGQPPRLNPMRRANPNRFASRSTETR